MQAQELKSDGWELLLIVAGKVVLGALRVRGHHGTFERFARAAGDAERLRSSR